MNERGAAQWIVLKFGGTSVSSLSNWRNIAHVAAARRAQGAQVLIVHSAVSGITDRLERLLAAASLGEHEAALEAIESRHVALCTELGIGRSAQLDGYFAELRSIALEMVGRAHRAQGRGTHACIADRQLALGHL
jgi:diaminopimelate decarboxylase/aspartate kinase